MAILCKIAHPRGYGEGLEMAGHRQIGVSTVGQDCEALRDYAFDEPKVVRAELPHECSHTHF